MTSLDIRLIEHGSPEYEETVALRDRILRRPLGLAYSPAALEAEKDSYHIACCENGELLACLILAPREHGRVQMRQVAVTAERQGQGVGRTLVQFAERFAADHGFSEIMLHARQDAVPFYEKLGYHRVGEQFIEVTIPHWEMIRTLS